MRARAWQALAGVCGHARSMPDVLRMALSAVQLLHWMQPATCAVSHARLDPLLLHGGRSQISGGFSRRTVSSGAVAAAAITTSTPLAAMAKSRDQGYPVQDIDGQSWVDVLSNGQYYILRQGGTEPPFSSPLVGEKRRGVFVCAGCATPLFDSTQKFESGTGTGSGPNNGLAPVPAITTACVTNPVSCSNRVRKKGGLRLPRRAPPKWRRSQPLVACSAPRCDANAVVVISEMSSTTARSSRARRRLRQAAGIASMVPLSSLSPRTKRPGRWLVMG